MQMKTYSKLLDATCQSCTVFTIYRHHVFWVWTPVIFWKVNRWNNPLPLHAFQTTRHTWEVNGGVLLSVQVRGVKILL